MPTVDDVLNLFEMRGESQYGGESVTQLQHALQAATLAERDGASPTLIAAALLHDVGHLLHDLPDDAADHGVDDCHESAGCNYLSRVFSPAVTEPVRLHVPAKRYLCAVEDSYRDQLSEPSIVSLELQGGAMSNDEVEAFQQNEFLEDAIRLRRWDDLAKDSQMVTPPLDHFADVLRAVAVGEE